MRERPSPQDATAEMKYAELRPPVKDHVRNLRAQLFELARKYGKKDPNDLRGLVESGDIPMEDVERITGLMLAMTESFKGDRLSGEAVKNVERELESWDELYRQVENDWKTVVPKGFHPRVKIRAYGNMMTMFAERGPGEVLERAGELDDGIRDGEEFALEMSLAWTETGELDRAIGELSREFSNAKSQANALEWILRSTVWQGDAARTEAVLKKLGKVDHRSILRAVKAFLFKRHDEAAARSFLAYTDDPKVEATANLSFARYQTENGGDPRPFLFFARDATHLFPEGDARDNHYLALAEEYARSGEIEEARWLIDAIKSEGYRANAFKVPRLARLLAVGGRADVARRFVRKSNAVAEVRAAAYFWIAQSEAARGIDAAESFALAETALRESPEEKRSVLVVLSAHACAETKRYDVLNRAIAALGKAPSVETLALDDEGRDRLFQSTLTLSEKDDGRELDRAALIGLIRILARQIMSGFDRRRDTLLSLARAEKRAGLDPADAIEEAWGASRGVERRGVFQERLAVTLLARELGVDADIYWSQLAMTAANSPAPRSELVSLAVARVGCGLPIDEQVRAIERTADPIARNGDLARVAHVQWKRAMKMFHLLPPAEQRRLRRKFGIMEPKER